MLAEKKKPDDKVKRELYCETHDVRIQLSNLENHAYPCVIRVGVRMRCKTHGIVINAEQVKGAHSECEVGPLKPKEGESDGR